MVSWERRSRSGARRGYYYFIPFTGDRNTPNELENQVRIMEAVIRYLVVKPEEKLVAAKAEEEKAAAETEAE